MRLEVPPATYYPGKNFFSGYDIPLRVIHVDSSPPFPEHRHDFHELVVVCSGDGRHFLDGVGHALRSGDVFLVPKGSTHEYAHPKDLNYINVLFDADSIFGDDSWPVWPECFPFASEGSDEGRYLRLSVFGVREVVTIINHMDQELFLKKDGYGFMAKAYLMQLWGLLSRKRSEWGEDGETSLSRVRRVLRFLDREPEASVSVEDMAREAGTGARNFHRLFLEAAGSPPLVYINKLRVEKARVLLRETDKTITQIAALVGYEDSNYFARQFRHFTGISPSGYREKERSET